MRMGSSKVESIVNPGTEAVLESKAATPVVTLDRESAHREAHRTILHRTYGPLRRALAGRWIKSEVGKKFELLLDSDGGFQMNCYDSGVHLAGRYRIDPSTEGDRLELTSPNGDAEFLRIVEVDLWRLTLDPAGEGELLELTRANAPGISPRR